MKTKQIKAILNEFVKKNPLEFDQLNTIEREAIKIVYEQFNTMELDDEISLKIRCYPETQEYILDFYKHQKVFYHIAFCYGEKGSFKIYDENENPILGIGLLNAGGYDHFLKYTPNGKIVLTETQLKEELKSYF